MILSMETKIRKGIQFGLGSQGIWTPELENLLWEEISKSLNTATPEYKICPKCMGRGGIVIYDAFVFCKNCGASGTLLK